MVGVSSDRTLCPSKLSKPKNTNITVLRLEHLPYLTVGDLENLTSRHDRPPESIPWSIDLQQARIDPERQNYSTRYLYYRLGKFGWVLERLFAPRLRTRPTNHKPLPSYIMSSPGEMDLTLEVSKSLLARAVKIALGFGGSIVFARIIGPTDYGGFYLLLSLVAISKTPIEAWMSSIKKRFAENQSDRTELVGLALAMIAAVTILTVILLGVSGRRLTEFTNVEHASVMFLLLFFVLTFYSSSQQLLAATGRVGLTNWIDTGRAIGTVLLRMGLILGGLGVFGMVYGLAGSTVLAVLGSFYFLRTRPSIPSWRTVKSVYSHARHTTVSALTGSLYGRLDQLLLGSLLATSWVGHYQIALQLSTPGQIVGGSIVEALLPKISNLSSKKEAVAEHVSNAIAFGSLIAVPILFGATAMPEVIVVTIYGPEFRSAGIFLVGLTLYRLIKTQTDIVQTTLNAIDVPEANVRTNFITVIANLILGVILGLEYGPVGIIVASVVAEFVKWVISVYNLKQIEPDVSLVPPLLRRQMVSGALMFGVVRLLNELIVVRSWVELLFIVGVGAVVYFAILSVLSEVFRDTGLAIARQIVPVN